MFFRIAIFWKKLIFEKKDIPHYLLFLERHFSECVRPNFS